MILTAAQIHEEVEAGNIVISPFSPENLNPCSYSYHMGDEILSQSVDRDGNEIGDAVPMPLHEDGVLLQPKRLYLTNTHEHIGSRKYVTLLSGCRPVAELGLFVQLSANLGNLGDAHRWTLELTCVQPVTIYPSQLIGQLTFWKPTGAVTYYSGQYTSHSRPVGNLHGATPGWHQR
jgi:dCTP deaminase